MRCRTLAFAATALLAARSPALASPPDAPSLTVDVPQPSLVTSPDWVGRPAYDAVTTAYHAVIKNGSSGGASVRCLISTEGRLQQCLVVRESSAGFGEVALRLTPLFRMRLADAHGAPVAGRQIFVPFQFGPD